MSSFDIDTFRARIGTTFRVAAPDHDAAVDIQLTEVADLAPGAVSMLFAGPADPVLSQATRELTTTDGDTVLLFLVPLGPGESAPMTYEAIINNVPDE